MPTQYRLRSQQPVAPVRRDFHPEPPLCLAFACARCSPTVGYARDFKSTGAPMTRSLRAGGIAIAAIAIGIGLSGCGSDAKSESSPSKPTSAAAAATPSEAGPTSAAAAPTPSEAAPTPAPPPAAAPNKTIVDYIKENNITEAPVHRGDPGA